MSVSDRVHDLITAALSQNRMKDARELIEQALSSMPPHWKPLEEDDREIRGAFWDQSEFFAYVGSHRSDNEKSIFWTTVSHPFSSQETAQGLDKLKKVLDAVWK